MPSRTNCRPIRLTRWGIPCAIACVGIGYLFATADRRKAPQPPAIAEEKSDRHSTDIPRSGAESTEKTVPIVLRNTQLESGIDFRHFPANRQSLLPEDMGSGLTWGDYDNDGDPDLFLVNFFGRVLEPIPDPLPTSEEGSKVRASRCALYRNDGNGRFTDVSHAAKLDMACFGMAAAWGDYDNDSDLDLYLTCYGPNRLMRNNGDGTFSDVTKAAGVDDDRFNTGCSWGDWDRDGHIDLYVCSYVDFEYRAEDMNKTNRQYGSETPYTINPAAYPPEPNRLYRNHGNGTFTDIAEKVGVANPTGRSLVAAWFDFEGDGWRDLYVANDISANGVFRNRGGGTFEDIGSSSLADDNRGAMGLAVGDFDHDGDSDLFVTHWAAQENAFFENAMFADSENGKGKPRLLFMDVAPMVGVAHSSRNLVGWATSFADFDNDGHADLWVVNGHTLEEAGDRSQLRPQRLQLYRQIPAKGFVLVSDEALPDLRKPIVGRGGAQADFDADGRVDLAVMVHGGAPILLHNESPGPGHWLTVRLRQRNRNTHALGARIVVHAGDLMQSAEVGAGAPYLSQNSTDVHFGLGSAATVEQLTIRWPDGAEETHNDVPIDQRATFIHTPKYGPP